MSSPFAVVTGGNRGIGHEVAKQLVQRGYTVILTAREAKAADEAAQKIGALGFGVDVTREDQVQQLAAFVQSRTSSLAVLINNAGVYPDRDSGALNVSLDLMRAGFETNALAPLRLTQLFAPLLRAHGHARVVNVSSGMGALTDMGGGSPAYRTSKTALNAITRLLADELQDCARVNVVCPGWVKTDMGGAHAPRSVEQGAASVLWGVTLEDSGPTGGFFRDGERVAW
jgi:NAD(P)-dependent dehydrogenase (short-subunit alcohol dehydrogenase family)